MTCRFQAVGSAIWRSEGTRIEGRIMAGGDPAAPPANVLALVRGPPHGRPPRDRSLECPGPGEDWSTAVQRPSPGPWTTDSYVESLLAGTQGSFHRAGKPGAAPRESESVRAGNTPLPQRSPP